MLRVDNNKSKNSLEFDEITGNAILYSIPTNIISVWQGIRLFETHHEDKQYIIVGTLSPSTGILYLGDVRGQSLSNYEVNFPGATSTSVYGPDYLGEGRFRLVGTYKSGDETVSGFIFEGGVSDLSKENHYRRYLNEAQFTYLHSTMGDLVVGNSDNPLQYGEHNLPLGPGNAFIYDLKKDEKIWVKFPGALTTTVYGIWYNGKNSYTICGGYSKKAVDITKIYRTENGVNRPIPIGHGFLVNYDQKSKKLSDWATTVDTPKNKLIHFEGISSSKSGHYELSADSLSPTIHGSWVSVKYKDNKFKSDKWINIDFPSGYDSSSANSVIGSVIVGLVSKDGKLIPYQANILE